MHGPFRRIVTSHAADDVDGSRVRLLDTTVPLMPALGGNAAFSPLFASLGVPAKSQHHIDDTDVSEAMKLAPGVVTPGGANGQVTDLAPNFKVGMHRTNSIDYNIFLAGSAFLITPDGETEQRTLVKAGEIVVQRGTLHAWEAGPEGARWCTVVVAALPVEAGGKPLPEVDF